MQVISVFLSELCDAVRSPTKSPPSVENLTVEVMVLDLYGQILTLLLVEFILLMI